MTLFRPRLKSAAQHFVVTHFEHHQDGVLTKAEAAFYEQHLATCQVCREWVARQVKVVDVVRQGFGPSLVLSPEATERIHQNLYHNMKRSQIMSNIKASIGALVAFAALILAAGLFIWWQQGTTDIAGQPLAPREEASAQDTPPQESLGGQAAWAENPAAGPDLDGLSQEELNERLLAALREDNAAEMDRLLEAGADANMTTAAGNTLLALAVSRGSKSLVASLLAHGVTVDAESGDAPVAIAAAAGYIEVVEQLLQAGADPNAVSAPAGTGTGEFAQLSGLHWAALNDNTQLAELLIAYGADINGVQPLTERTPLHMAAYYRGPQVLELLLAHGADMERRDSGGNTVLFFAVQGDNVDIARTLIEAGAALDATNDLGLTLVKQAGPNAEMVQLLQEAGAEE